METGQGGIARPRWGPQLVDTDELIEYPLGLDERLEGRFYMAWHHDRWLNSRLRLSAPPDVRGLAFDLFCLAQKQTPVGTLPDDDVQLAALLLLDLKTWQQYRARSDWSPLYHWVPCRCGAEIRLMHTVVLEVIEEAIGLRERRIAEADLGRRRKRMERLPQQILEAGGTRAMSADQGLIEWLDAWLEKNCRGYRTRAQVRRGLEVYSSSVDL